MPRLVAILSLITVLPVCFAQSSAAREYSPLQLHSEAGWEFPELRRILAGKPQSYGNIEIAGTTVRYRTFAVSAADRKPVRALRVLLISHKDEIDYVSWLNVEPRRVTAYDVGNKVFGVTVEGVIRHETDPATGAGGTGGEIRIAYEDPDGGGQFKVLLHNLPPSFRPGVPEWARK